MGPPGVGKSTLAIHVANEIEKRHVDVCYFKIEDFPKGEFQQAFMKNLLGDKNDSLSEWAYNQHENILIVLDDCDIYINEQNKHFIKQLKRLFHIQRE